MSNAAYYRDRAICRKILAEGTGLQVDRMADAAIRERIQIHLDRLLAHAADGSVTYPPLMRALVELDALYGEQVLRGSQLPLFDPGPSAPAPAHWTVG